MNQAEDGMSTHPGPQLIAAGGPIAGAFFANGALYGAWASRIPTVKDTFDLTPSALGLLLLVLASGAVVAFPLAGRATDRLGARGVTRVLAILFVASFVFIGLAPTLWTLVAALFLFGATFGGMDVAMNTWGTALERQRGIVALPALHATFSLGAGIGAATGYLALNLDLSLAGHALALSLPALALCLLPGGVATPAAPAKQSDTPAFGLPDPAILLVGLVTFAMVIGEGAMADWSAVYLVEQTGSPQSHAALGYTVFSVTMVTMRLFGSTLLRLLAPPTAIVLSCALAAAGAFLAAATTHYGTALTGFALMGFGFALVMPLSMSTAARISEGNEGRAIAAVATFGYGGLLLGPPLIGFVAEFGGYPAAFGTIGLLAVAACAGFRSFRTQTPGG